MTTHKVVLITGCSTGGIGFHLCEEYAARFCKVYATSRSVSTIGEFKNASIQKMKMDVTSDEDVQVVVKAILEAEGRIDIVVNNAGALGVRPIVDLTLEQVKYNFDLNTFSAIRTAKAVFPIMAAQKSGQIINVGSIVGNIPTPWNGIYAASKAALHTITEVLQMEFTPFNISVILVAPGAIRSQVAYNAETTFKLPPDSLYFPFLHNILDRMHSSQDGSSMPTDKFAQLVVGKSLGKNPPRYITAGGNSLVFRILEWLPKTLVLFLMWKRFSGRKRS